MRPVLAKNMEEATPKVEAWVKDVVLPYFRGALINEVFVADPCYADVQDREGNRWTDGQWGVRIRDTGFFSVYDHGYWLERSADENALCVDDISIHAMEHGVHEIRIALSGRLSSPWEEE